MIRTGEEYRQGLQDGREIWMDGERVKDVTTHPGFKPIVDIRARMYDMAHEAATRIASPTSRTTSATRFSTSRRARPRTGTTSARPSMRSCGISAASSPASATRRSARCGRSWDGKDILNEIDPRFARNIETAHPRAIKLDPFHVSANTDPKGDRSKRPQDQDPDMLVHVVKETDAGIVIRGAKYETAAAYANQAFLKPTIANWARSKLSEYALGCIVKMDAPGVKHICRPSLSAARRRATIRSSNRFDEVDTLLISRQCADPLGGRALLSHTRAAAVHPPTLHRYSAFPYVQRLLSFADMMIGAAMWNVQPDRPRQAAGRAREARRTRRLARGHQRASDRRDHTRAEESRRPSDAEPVDPDAGRVHGCREPAAMMHIARELCGGQICVTPNAASFHNAGSAEWLKKFYTLNKEWESEDRRKLLAFARDLLNSDYAGHRLTFVQFAQAPHFNHLAAVYNSFDFSGPLDFVRKAAGLSDKVTGKSS